MKQKDLLWQWLAVGICCIAFGGSMSAATITQTCTIAAASVPYTQSCTLNLFDPAGGTLTSVVLSLTGVGGDVVPEQTVTNSSTQTFTNSVATVALTMTGPDSIVVTDTSSPCAGTVVGPATNTSCSPTTFSGLSASPVTGTTADYIGTGTITPSITASGQITSTSGVGGVGSAGNLFFGGDGAIGGTFTLTYTYTPALLTPAFSKAFGQPSIAVGSSTTLTFTITNPNATSALTGLAFTDSLPAGLAVASPNGLTSTCGGTTTATAGGTSVSLSGGTVPASGTCTISVNVLGIAAGIQNNTTSTLTSNAPTAAAATASITVVPLTPTLSKAFGQPSIVVGSSTTLTFTITNPNASGLTSAAFTDMLPSGLAVATPNGLTSTCGGITTATAGGSSISLSGGTVSASSSCTISVNVLGIAAGTQNNTTSTLTSNDPTAGAATASIDVLNAVPAPTFSKAFGQPSIVVGSSTTLTFTITNLDVSGLTSVAFTDTLPSGLAVATPNGLTSTCGGTTTATAGGSSISLSGGTVAASSSCTISVNVLGIAAGIQNNTTST
ncbi:MAG: choice-of-anchor E domain-containing protein, partial [Bryobacteraceae bacterium]